MENLVLTDANVLPERDVILEERRQRVDASPGAILGEALNAALYANHPYGIPIIGWEHEMAQLTREDAIAFYDRYYTPNNAILVIAGDVDPPATLKLAEEIYGTVKRRAEPGVRKRAMEPEPMAERRVSYSDPRISSPSISRTYSTVSYGTAEPGEAEALDILSTILGGASTSRIRNALLVATPIASRAGAYYLGGYRDYGEFTVYGEPLPGTSIEQMEARLDEIISRVVRDGVTAAEVESAREMLVRTTIFERDSQGTMARIYGTVLAAGGDLADVAEWPDRIRAVTVDDVNKAARKWLDRRRSVTGLLLPKEES
jgi:zinc protease